MPDKDPITIVNNFVIYWFLADMVFRYFLQQLPVLNIKPYMVIPIKRSVVIHFLLGKTSISFFNFLPLFFFLPFSITLLVNGDYYLYKDIPKSYLLTNIIYKSPEYFLLSYIFFLGILISYKSFFR